MLRITNVILLLVSGYCLNAQPCPDSSQQALLKHFSQPELLEERLHWLNGQLRNDSCFRLKAEKAWTFAHLNKPEKAVAEYERISPEELHLSGFEKDYIRCLFQTGKSELLLKNAGRWPQEANYAARLLHLNLDVDSLSDQKKYSRVNDRYLEYRTIRKKSVVLAGLFSLIPGCGKWYIGRGREGRNSAILTGLTGGILVEVILLKGIKSGFVYPAAALFGIFYLGSVYGTVATLVKNKHDFKEQLRFEITRNLLADYGIYPWPGRSTND